MASHEWCARPARSLRLPDRDAGFESTETCHPRRRCVQHERTPQRDAADGKLESIRHHADDRVADTVDAQGVVIGRFSGPLLPPQARAHDDDPAVGDELVWRELASPHRQRTERVDQSLRDFTNSDRPRLAGNLHNRGVELERVDAIKQRAVEVERGSRRRRDKRDAHSHEAFGVRKW